jgi:hypothetical protein
MKTSRLRTRVFEDDEPSRAPHLNRVAGMDLGYDPKIEQGWVRIQFVAWIVMTVLVVAGLSGVFGRGPLANATAASADGAVRVTYERFVRFRTPTATTITLQGPFAGPVTVTFSQRELTIDPVQNVVPRPIAQRAVPDGVAFVFAPPPAGGPATIAFTEQPATLAAGHPTISVGNEAPFKLLRVVYP